MVEPVLLMPNSPPAKSEVARARLLEAGLNVFSERGIKGATVRDIAKAAGQNVAAIAYYFGNKENLYKAIVEGIAREIRRRMADVVEQIDLLRRQPHPKPAEAISLLKLALRGIYLRLTSRTDTLAIGRLIVREQTQPSAEFEILYREVFRELHERLSFLVGTVLRTDPEDERIIIRTHALIGQLWFFAIARETILRRLGWRDLEGANAQRVAELVEEHVDILLSGLIARRERKRKASKS